MKIKHFLSLLAVSLLPLGASAVPAQKIAIRSEIASPVVMANSQENNYLKVSLTGFALEAQQRSPINLAIVIDRSTSMNGDRIEKARDAAIMAVHMLNENDTLSVITYDTQTEVIVPPTKVKNKEAIIKKIRNNTAPRGMTALFAGVSKGIEQVNKHLAKEQVNRIILLSDGQANTGPTSTSELSGLAKMAAKKGIAITTMGIGNNYNEDLMTAIANYSDGNHAYVEKSSDLELTFAKEFDDVMSVVAQDVEVTIRVADKVKPVRLLGREGEIRGNTVTVRLNQLYSKQEKYVLLEVVPASGKKDEEKPLAEVSVKYDNLGTKKKDSYQKNLMISYTDSSEKIKKSIAEDVLVDSEIQKMALDNEKVVKLIDEGKTEEAKAVIQRNTTQMEELQVSNPEAQEKLSTNVQMNKDLMKQMDRKDKNVSRKALKEQDFAVKKQKNTKK